MSKVEEYLKKKKLISLHVDKIYHVRSNGNGTVSDIVQLPVTDMVEHKTFTSYVVDNKTEVNILLDSECYMVDVCGTGFDTDYYTDYYSFDIHKCELFRVIELNKTIKINNKNFTNQMPIG